MPLSFHVDKDAGILHVQAIGHVNDAEVMDLRDRLNNEAAFIAGWAILCDCSVLTGLQISSNLIEFLAKGTRTRQNLLAIIAPGTFVFGMARMYQIYSDPDEKRIRVFDKAKEAMVWLNAGIKETVRHLCG